MSRFPNSATLAAALAALAIGGPARSQQTAPVDKSVPIQTSAFAKILIGLDRGLRRKGFAERVQNGTLD